MKKKKGRKEKREREEGRQRPVLPSDYAKAVQKMHT